MSDTDNRDPRLDAAYRAAPHEEPPTELDERIRAAARRAVTAGPQSVDAAGRIPVQRSWASRWRVPVSLAATVVIVVTLTVMMQDEETRRAKLDGAVNGAPPAAEAAKRAAPAAEAEAARIDERAASSSARPFRPQPSATGELRAPSETQAPAPASQAAGKLESPAASGALSKEREIRQADTATAAPPPAPAVPTAPAPAVRTLPSREAAEALSRDRSVADRPGRMERGAAPAAADPKARTPEAWIEEIRRLKAQGRDAEAAAELAEFRKRHPDFALPPDFAK